MKDNKHFMLHYITFAKILSKHLGLGFIFIALTVCSSSMSSIEATKQARTTSKCLFTQCVNGLIKIIEKGDDDLAVVESRFSDLKERWKEVQERHEAYLTFLTTEEEKFDEETWINQLDETYTNVERQRFTYVQEQKKQIEADLRLEKEIAREASKRIKIVEEERTLIQARQIRSLEEITFMQEIENLNEILSQAVDKSGQERILAPIIKETLKDIKSQLEKCKQVHNHYISLLDKESILIEIHWIAKLQSIHSQANVKAAKFIQAHTEHAGSDSFLKIERMKLPTFDGDIRDYPRFKSDFKKQVIPGIKQPETVAYVLRSCLSKTPFEIIRNIDDDLTEMWKRLDDKYGKASKLTDVVMYDIKRLRAVREGDNKKFIELVDIIERGYRDLARLCIEHEISNSTTVSLIEEKLPRDVRREWSKEVNRSGSKVDDANKFPSLLEFLLEQKRIIEYESAELRNVGFTTQTHGFAHHVEDSRNYDESPSSQIRSHRCLIHGSSGHSTPDCRIYINKEPEERVQLLKEKRACWSCLKFGHRSSDCRLREKCPEEGCNMFHHESLHTAHVQGVNFHINTSLFDGEGNYSNACLLQLMNIKAGTEMEKNLNVLWDGGATLSLITFKNAREIGLFGKEIKITVIKVGGQRENISSYVYNLPLIDKEGEVVYFQVYGINKISTSVQQFGLKEVVGLFKDLDGDEVKRPNGEIDVLIGFEYAGFHPVREQLSHHLLLLSHRFGRCLGGSFGKLYCCLV